MIPQNEISIGQQIESRLREFEDKASIGIRHDQHGAVICYYCGEPLHVLNTHRDHVTPKSRGGLDLLWNIVLSCGDCNIRKSIKPPLYYLGRVPDDLQIDFLARLLLGGAVSLRQYTPSDSPPASESLSDIADKVSTLSLQLQQITKWLHMIEQEIIDHQTRL